MLLEPAGTGFASRHVVSLRTGRVGQARDWPHNTLKAGLGPDIHEIRTLSLAH